VKGLAGGSKSVEEPAIRDAKRKLMECGGIFLILPMYGRTACINQDKYDSCDVWILLFFLVKRKVVFNGNSYDAFHTAK
jgi:hypothetical protein